MSRPLTDIRPTFASAARCLGIGARAVHRIQKHGRPGGDRRSGLSNGLVGLAVGQVCADEGSRCRVICSPQPSTAILAVRDHVIRRPALVQPRPDEREPSLFIRSVRKFPSPTDAISDVTLRPAGWPCINLGQMSRSAQPAREPAVFAASTSISVGRHVGASHPAASSRWVNDGSAANNSQACCLSHSVKAAPSPS
jgi:hypothetical protein